MSELENRPSAPEQEQDTPTYLDRLQGKVLAFAETKFWSDLRNLTRFTPSLESTLYIDQIPSYTYDHSLNSLSMQAVLHELGVLDHLKQMETDAKKVVTTPRATVQLEKLSWRGFGIKILALDQVQFDESLEAAQSASTFQRLISPLLTEITQDERVVESSDSFSFSEALLSNCIVFEKLGCLQSLSPTQLDVTEELLEKVLHEVITTNTHFQLHPCLKLTLIPVGAATSVLTQRWRVKLEKDITPYVLETANNGSAQTEHFLFRKTGVALINAHSAAGLELSPQLVERLVYNYSGASRYGGVYAELSRTLAKVLWSKDIQKISAAFVSQQQAAPTLEMLRCFALQPVSDPGVQEIQKVLLQLLAEAPADRSDLPVTQQKIAITDGACFDVLVYYCQAHEMRNLKFEYVGATPLLAKTHGADTYINCEPLSFDGVTLPKGCLFTRAADGGFAFLRFTPFMFDTIDQMISSFGTEVIKYEENLQEIPSILNMMRTLEHKYVFYPREQPSKPSLFRRLTRFLRGSKHPTRLAKHPRSDYNRLI